MIIYHGLDPWSHSIKYGVNPWSWANPWIHAHVSWIKFMDLLHEIWYKSMELNCIHGFTHTHHGFNPWIHSTEMAQNPWVWIMLIDLHVFPMDWIKRLTKYKQLIQFHGFMHTYHGFNPCIHSTESAINPWSWRWIQAIHHGFNPWIHSTEIAKNP